MNFRKFGSFLVVVALMLFAFTGFQYYMTRWEMRWEAAKAIGDQIRGDPGPWLSFRMKTRDMESDARIAAIIGGVMFVIGVGLRVSTTAVVPPEEEATIFSPSKD